MAQKLIFVRSTSVYSIRAFAATQLVKSMKNISNVFLQLGSSSTLTRNSVSMLMFYSKEITKNRYALYFLLYCYKVFRHYEIQNSNW